MIVAALAIESGAALWAFLILSSLLVGAADGFDGIVVADDVVDAAVEVVSAPGVADLLQAVKHAIDTTREKGSWTRMNASDYRQANIRARGELLLAVHRATLTVHRKLKP
jgi:hypothetical protein